MPTLVTRYPYLWRFQPVVTLALFGGVPFAVWWLANGVDLRILHISGAYPPGVVNFFFGAGLVLLLAFWRVWPARQKRYPLPSPSPARLALTGLAYGLVSGCLLAGIVLVVGGQIQRQTPAAKHLEELGAICSSAGSSLTTDRAKEIADYWLDPPELDVGPQDFEHRLSRGVCVAAPRPGAVGPSSGRGGRRVFRRNAQAEVSGICGVEGELEADAEDGRSASPLAIESTPTLVALLEQITACERAEDITVRPRVKDFQHWSVGFSVFASIFMVAFGLTRERQRPATRRGALRRRLREALAPGQSSTAKTRPALWALRFPWAAKHSMLGAGAAFLCSLLLSLIAPLDLQVVDVRFSLGVILGLCLLGGFLVVGSGEDPPRLDFGALREPVTYVLLVLLAAAGLAIGILTGAASAWLLCLALRSQDDLYSLLGPLLDSGTILLICGLPIMLFTVMTAGLRIVKVHVVGATTTGPFRVGTRPVHLPLRPGVFVSWLVPTVLYLAGTVGVPLHHLLPGATQLALLLFIGSGFLCWSDIRKRGWGWWYLVGWMLLSPIALAVLLLVDQSPVKGLGPQMGDAAYYAAAVATTFVASCAQLAMCARRLSDLEALPAGQ